MTSDIIPVTKLNKTDEITAFELAPIFVRKSVEKLIGPSKNKLLYIPRIRFNKNNIPTILPIFFLNDS